eukprot:8315814-Lingulodinium_polyedra.AAC.1
MDFVEVADDRPSGHVSTNDDLYGFFYSFFEECVVRVPSESKVLAELAAAPLEACALSLLSPAIRR